MVSFNDVACITSVALGGCVVAHACRAACGVVLTSMVVDTGTGRSFCSSSQGHGAAQRIRGHQGPCCAALPHCTQHWQWNKLVLMSREGQHTHHLRHLDVKGSRDQLWCWHWHSHGHFNRGLQGNIGTRAGSIQHQDVASTPIVKGSQQEGSQGLIHF